VVSEERIKSMLCCAFEGGSRHWIESYDYKYADGVKREDFKEGGRLNNPNPGDEYWHPTQLVPLHEGCAIIIKVSDEDDKKKYKLDRKTLEKGLQVFASKYPRLFNEMMEENDDANTGDVFLQTCLFGEERYC
jgi:hypothetical protein